MVRPLAIVLCLCTILLPPVASGQQPMVTGQIEQNAQLRPEEMLHFTDGTLAMMQAGVTEVAQTLEAAEGAGNMAIVQCISSRLITMRSLFAVTETSGESLRHALSTGATDLAQHELRKVTIAHAKFLQLKAEAAGCQGGNPVDGPVTVVVTSSAVHTRDETNPLDPDYDTGADPHDTSQFQ